jgi:aminopeptidase
MLNSKQLLNYAKSLIWGLKTARKESGGEFKSGETVLLLFDLLSIKLAEIIQGILIKEGINVILEMSKTTDMDLNFYGLSSNDQLKFLPNWRIQQWESLSGLIKLIAPQSLTHLKDVDPGKIAMVAKSRKKFREILDKKEAHGKFGWTLCVMPTDALAKASDMTLQEYEDEVAKICHLNDEDASIFWGNLYQKSKKIINYLEKLDINHIRIETASGSINLNVGIGPFRKWISTSGHNIPSFEVFTSPDWRKVNGIYYANTLSFKDGNEVRNVQLLFENGKVIEASAEVGNDYLQEQLKIDEGARQLGEISFTAASTSLITRYMGHILYDENVGGENGNCHVAIGASFPDAYRGEEDFEKIKKELGYNDSALHWDLINTEEKIGIAVLELGNEVIFYKEGEFILPESK